MSQANVYTTVANARWYTDKCEIVAGNTAVTYNIYQVALPPQITVSGTTANLSTVITTSAAMALPAGSAITGTGIAASTTIVSQIPFTSVTLSANATANATSVFTVTTPPSGNMYSNAPQVSANGRQQIFVGAGNYLTVTGANFTVRELGTASSATAGVNGQG
jgi:hypothetical protein